jgi:capsular polysaccharide biosynthesis protein
MDMIKLSQMKLIFSPPSIEDLIRLLKAWRFWLLAALIGALIGAALYSVAPPPYRARATVLVDFNLEEAWPKDTDRQQFYYLERESRKLEEIAWSDSVLQIVAQNHSVTISELRDKKLTLSQPAEGGWHFYADDKERKRAESIASTWAQAFADQARAKIGQSDGLNSFIQIDVTQSADLPVERGASISTYLFASALTFMTLATIGILFFQKRQ